VRVTTESPLEFKFHWLNDKGQPTGVFRKKGRFDGEVLTLDDVQVPAVVLLHVESRENRMAVSAMTPDGKAATMLLMPATNRVTQDLKSALDVARSRAWAQMHQAELSKNGRGHTYREAECPHCGAMIVLSDMPPTPQLYCRFCNSLTTTDDPVAGEQHLKLCDECGMFSRPTKFTIFYFYFLLVVYGWYSKSTWRCPPCMRGEAWKMLFGNLLFVLGVPVALVQLFRSYGGSSVGGQFKGLDAGNLKARKGDLSGALAQYRSILERVPNCAGVKYNLGLALLQQGDKQRAADSFRIALGDCVNYIPAYAQLRRLYEELNETEKLKALLAQWESPEEQVGEAPTS
jgi:hypothetical protein